MKNFITNSDAENLKHRLVELIQNSKELKFLVGFFYFSGLQELFESLQQNPHLSLKVLVGLQVDRLHAQLIELADAEDEQNSLSNQEIFEKFLRSLKTSINTETFDKKEFYEQLPFFMEMLRQDRLILRKTLRPNHAKLYLFKLKEQQIKKNLFITGSSNLTSAGLATQNEFNVEIGDYGFQEAEEYFDALWEDAVPVSENTNWKKELIQLLEKETLISKITPFEAYLLALKIYLDSFEKKEVGDSLKDILKENHYTPYQYQLDAIAQALAVLEKHQGVILADVVGLGKTVIACAVAREMRQRGVIVCPPGIMGDPRTIDFGWNRVKEEFGLDNWKVWSSGDLEKLQAFTKKANNIEVVIIDEAHRFRNQDTRSYESLKNICRNKKVILLTATPFNNRPGDILSLLKLFITPKKSTITLENNLAEKFKYLKSIFEHLSYIKKYIRSSKTEKRKKAEARYKKLFGVPWNPQTGPKKIKERSQYLAKQIRDVIEPVTIRRNRLDLKHNPLYKEEAKELSEVANPKEWFFELTEEQSQLYDNVIECYFGDPDEGGMFKGAIYRPFEYEKEKVHAEKLSEKENREYQQQRNLYDFMRRLLVKRFESSFGSFEQSLKNFKHINESVLAFIQKTQKYILDRSLLEKIYFKDIEEIESYLSEYRDKIKADEYPKNHKIYELSKMKGKETFLAHIRDDIALFSKILERMHALNLVKKDPKTDCLIKNLQAQLQREPHRKIVIFSEYRDTVTYLEEQLKPTFKERLLVITGALTQTKMKAIHQNFDASYPDPTDKFDILLSTDKLSEGFNLNRAGLVINYDIPWNPVRVIQRVGRINRISKKVFDELYIVNFFPTERGAELVKSREIATHKMFLIHNTLGEDAKIFDIDEEPTRSDLYTRLQQNPEALEQESFYTQALNLFCSLQKKHPELIAQLASFAPRVKVAKEGTENELIVLFRKGRLYIRTAKYSPEKIDLQETTMEEILERIQAEQETPRCELSEHFWDAYETVKKGRRLPLSPPLEQSIEQKAINCVKALLYAKEAQALNPYRSFLRTLRSDLLDYGTLSDYTLRRLANLEWDTTAKLSKTVAEIQALKEELGENYLDRELASRKDLNREIIVAIENRALSLDSKSKKE